MKLLISYMTYFNRFLLIFWMHLH